MSAVNLIWLLVTIFHINGVNGIFGGDILEKPFRYFARVVSIYYEKNAQVANICGGTIIRSNLVLTARSCVAGALRIHVITSDNPSESDAANNVFEATVQSMEKKEEEKVTRPVWEKVLRLVREPLYNNKLALLRLNSRVEEKNLLRFCRDYSDVRQQRMVSVNPGVTGNLSVFYTDMNTTRNKFDILFDWQPVEMGKCFGWSDVGNPIFGIEDVDMHDCLHSVVTEPALDHVINGGNFRTMEALKMTRILRKMIESVTVSIANELHAESSTNENPSVSSDGYGPSTSRGKTLTWSNEVKVQHIPKNPKRQFRSGTVPSHMAHSELVKHVIDKLNEEKERYGASCKRSFFKNLASKF